MKFTKMQGAGNDYIYIDARGLSEDWCELSRKMSDRHFGIGGDGIILIMDSEIADLKMRMFNADGSEGEMCGNGIRCFAKYAIERKIAENFGGSTLGHRELERRARRPGFRSDHGAPGPVRAHRPPG